MYARLMLTPAAAFLLAGCYTRNQYAQLRDTLARLPNGDEITCVESIDTMSDRQYTDTSLQWRRVASTESLLQIQGRGEVRVKEIGRVLAIQGEPYIQSGRKVYYNSEHRTMTPEEIARSKQWQEMFAHAETRVSPDNNHVWLVYKGQTFASFDYDKSIAIFGTQNQPAWAASASEK